MSILCLTYPEIVYLSAHRNVNKTMKYINNYCASIAANDSLELKPI